MSVPVIPPKRSYDAQNEGAFREEMRRKLAGSYDRRGDVVIPFGKRLAFTSAQGQEIYFGYNGSGQFTIQQDAVTPVSMASVSLVTSVETTLTTSIASLTVDVAAANAAASAAASSASSAATSATAAGTSATAANTSATNASTSASNASTSASQSSTSATNAAGSAATATTQATNAATSATNASNSASAASTSASTASTQATAAGTSASAANTSATNAATQASNAATSATAASTSAGNASTSASNASTSASNAAGSASAASTSQTAAAGSATSAGNSATAASTSASNASTSATNAGNSASSASTSATNAATSATNAGTSASAASTSASSAATQATNAATSASAAQTSLVSAKATAVAQGIGASTFDADGLYWTGDFGGASTAAADPIGATYGNVTSVGRVLQWGTSSGTRYLTQKFAMQPVAGRKYRLTIRVRVTADATGGGVLSASLSNVNGLDTSYVHGAPNVTTTAVSGFSTGTGAATVASGWQTIAAQHVLATPGTYDAFWRPRLDLTRSGGAGGSFEVAYFRLEDVTESEAAATSATASASSASSATASQSAAASSASAASTSATNAATSASNASTSASQASTSETNAAGSASTASTQATNAATSQSAAAGSATAASGSASTASTQASNAATSASAAATSATTATTQASNASTSAGQASTSAGNAASSATTATTQASNAAASATTATTQASNASASASAASSSASVVASYTGRTGGSITVNPVFNNYASGGTLPVGWGSLVNGTGSRQTGKVGAYAHRLVGGAGADAITWQPSIVASPGSFQVEFACELISGTYAGAGAAVYATTAGGGGLELWYFSIATLADTNGDISTTKTGIRYFRTSPVTFPATTGAVNLYAMSHNSSIGSIASANSIDWHQCDLAPVTYATAKVEVNTAAIATTDGKLTASYGLTVDGNGRIASMKLLSNGTTSSVKFKADTFAIYNSVSDVAVFNLTGSQLKLNADLNVSSAIRVGAARLKVALESIRKTGADGAAITWADGVSIGSAPEYVLDLSTLAPLTTGETYSVYLTAVTATGATVYAKILTPGTTTTVTQTTDAAGGGGDPTRVMAKSDSADAYDGVYDFRVVGTMTITGVYDGSLGQWVNSGNLIVSTWFNDGGGWDQGPNVEFTTSYLSGSNDSGSSSVDDTFPVSWANAIGAGATNDFGISAVSGGTVTDLHTVSYSKQTSSGLRTASPSGQTVKIAAFPRNA